MTGAAIQEQLGDLKLYRVPEPTTVASRQSKQVRLLDRTSIPFTRLYKAELSIAQMDDIGSLGSVTFPLLLKEVNIRDLAVNEDVEIDMGESADVELRVVLEERTVDSDHARRIPLVPGVVALREEQVSPVLRVEVTNARAADAQLELVLSPLEGARIVRAYHKLSSKNGQPMFRLTVPANGTATVRFQPAMTESRPTSD